MRVIIPILILLGFLVLGYILMSRLDKFLEQNRNAIKTENEKQSPSCVMLSGELSDEELAEELMRFRNQHEDARVLLFSSSDPTFSKMADRKPDEKK